MANPFSKLFSAEYILRNDTVQGELPPNRDMLSRLFRMALPATAEAVLLSLVSLVDTIMVSNLGTYAITAVGLTTQPRMLFMSFYWAVTFATSAIIARRHGEDDRENANRTLKCALIIIVLMSAAFGVIAVLFGGELVRLVGAKPDTQEYAAEYFRIVVGCSFFSAVSMTMNAAQRGIGNTKITLRTNIVSNLVNLCGNFLLIEGRFGFPALGVRGAAVATVAGTVVAFVMSTASLLPKDSFVHLRYKLTGALFNRQTTGAMWKIGSGALWERLTVRVGFILFAVIVASLGTDEFAVYQIGMNVMTISFSFGDGLSVAAIALVGFSLGQRRSDLAKVYVKCCQRIGFIISIVLSALYVFLGKQIYMLFSKDPYIYNSGQQVMRVLCVIVVIQISVVIYMAALRAAGDTRFTSLVSWATLLRPAVCYLLCVVFEVGLYGAFVGIAVDQLLRLILVVSRFSKGKWTEHIV